MAEKFVKIPFIYPKLLELRQSKNAVFKPNRYLRDSTILRYYQVIGSLHMMLLNRMVLADDAGLGKTLQVIAAYSFLLEQDPTLKLLVVCTKSALYQWKEEFEKFTQGITCRILENEWGGLTGAAARNAQYKNFKENVLIMGYNPLLEEYELIKQCLEPNYMVVFDECQAFKGRKTKTHFACEQVAQGAKRVYGLSATVIKNTLEEIWSIYSVIVPGLFGNITSFYRTFTYQKLMKVRAGGRERYIPQIDITRGYCGYKNLETFKKLIDPYILTRKKEEVASELPRLISKKIVLEMFPEQKEIYKKALHGIVYEEKVRCEFFRIYDLVRNGTADEKTLKQYDELKEKYEATLSGEGRRRGKLAALTYCQMISNGPSLIGEQGESSKEEEFRRLISEELIQEKIIVFTRFKRGIFNLEVICDKCGIGYTKITGDITSAQERDRNRLKFMNDPLCRIIFITTAGSASLNLQSAGVIIFYDTPWSYGDLVQTIGRAQRMGSLQEHILLLHLCNKGTIDMRVLDRVTSKKELSDKVVGDSAKGALDFSENEETVIDDLYNDILEDAKQEV